MIPVAEARARLLALVGPAGVETVPLIRAGGRVLAEPVVAGHAQPPFAASSMDGYACAGAVSAGDRLRVVGEAAAGRPHGGAVADGAAVRIFTGAAMPNGADRVLIQEDAAREGGNVRATVDVAAGENVRPAGGDFAAGHVLDAPRRIRPADVALIAAMGHATVRVARPPEVAVLMTGDELVTPGGALGPGAIYASNGYGLAAMLEAEGARARLLPLARDDPASLRAALAMGRGADLIVTVGGASVGDHDIVAPVAGEAGLDLSFHKVRMRPGKPLLAGRLGDAALIGLPGNPVSAMVCGVVFVLPVLRRMLGLAPGPKERAATLAAPLDANGSREHYMRARLTDDGTVAAVDRQDSSLLTRLAAADVLIRRDPSDPAREAGDAVRVIDLRQAHVPLD